MNILITGGSSGLGEAMVRKLACDPGNYVFFTYAKSIAKATALTREFSNTSAIHCDFRDKASLFSLTERLGVLNIDILINNAMAYMHKNYFHKNSPNHFASSFGDNVVPVLLLTQECIKVFRKKKFGKIINIASSVLANDPPVGWSEYAANKAYLVAMSKSWATENIRFNITSNCISPSLMETAFTSDIDERVLEEMAKSHPLKQLLTPDEVADCAAFLTKSSQHINGLNIVMNAGLKACFFISFNLSNLLDVI